MANGPVYYTLPVRSGVDMITYIGTISGAISTYASKLSSAYTDRPDGGLPNIYSPTAPVQGFNNLEQNKTYLLFTKESFNLGVSGNYVPPQPASFRFQGAGFHAMGFDDNCRTTPISGVGPLVPGFNGIINSNLDTVVCVNPAWSESAPPGVNKFLSWFKEYGNRTQQFGLYNYAPLSSYYCYTSNTVTVTAKRIVNLLLTDDGRFLLTDAPGYSAIQVSVESP